VRYYKRITYGYLPFRDGSHHLSMFRESYTSSTQSAESAGEDASPTALFTALRQEIIIINIAPPLDNLLSQGGKQCSEMTASADTAVTTRQVTFSVIAGVL
jgi:hypothetical protein